MSQTVTSLEARTFTLELDRSGSTRFVWRERGSEAARWTYRSGHRIMHFDAVAAARLFARCGLPGLPDDPAAVEVMPPCKLAELAGRRTDDCMPRLIISDDAPPLNARDVC